MKEENTLFEPEEMRSPFNAIKEVDGEGWALLLTF